MKTTEQLLKEATARPWVAGRADMATLIDGSPGKFIYSGDSYVAATGFDADDWGEVMANAALIVRAVNSFEAMLEALRLLLSTENQVIKSKVLDAAIDALDLAEGKETK